MLKKLPIILIILISLLIIPIQPNKFYSSKSPIFSYHGRHSYFNNNNSIKYDWSCFKISFCYHNISTLTLHIQDTWNFYDVVFNNNQTVKVQMKKNIIKQINRTKYQSGCVQIIKITENHYGPLGSHTDSVFNGITIDNGQLIQKQQHFKYKFQFLGDSLTTSFGDMSNTNPTCMLKMRKSQNCRYSWATLLSQMFQADYRIVAISGRGVTHNSIGVPGQTMPNYFTRITSNSLLFSYQYQDNYFSDAIFILLGANDFNNIHPSRTTFISQYKSMLNLILKQYLSKSSQKHPKIICLCESSQNSQLCLMTRQAVKQIKFSYNQVYYVKMPSGVFKKDNLGCVAHPNVNGHKIMAHGVYNDVKQILEG